MKEPIDYLSTLFVWIDIASRIHVVSALDFNEKFYIKMKPVKNTQEGTAFIEQMISDVLEHNHQFKFVVIGMEATGFYDVHLTNYLSSSDLLAPFSVRVYCLNPKEVKNYKKSFKDIGRNDDIDSYMIADFARVGRIAIKPWRGSQRLALQRLTRHRMHITECIAREKTYMLNNIYLKFSQYALLRDGQHPFAVKYGATAEAILTKYTTNEDLVNSPVEDLVAFINSKSKGRIADPEETAKMIQTAARNSYRLDKYLYEPLAISIASSFNCISSFEKELKAIDKAILQTV